MKHTPKNIQFDAAFDELVELIEAQETYQQKLTTARSRYGLGHFTEAQSILTDQSQKLIKTFTEVYHDPVRAWARKQYNPKNEKLDNLLRIIAHKADGEQLENLVLSSELRAFEKELETLKPNKGKNTPKDQLKTQILVLVLGVSGPDSSPRTLEYSLIYERIKALWEDAQGYIQKADNALSEILKECQA